MMALAVLVFVIDLVVIVNIVQSAVRPAAKVVWVVAVLLLPLVGAIAWFLAPPPRRHYGRR